MSVCRTVCNIFHIIRLIGNKSTQIIHSRGQKSSTMSVKYNYFNQQAVTKDGRPARMAGHLLPPLNKQFLHWKCFV